MWQMSKENGIMESECIIVPLCLISGKKNNILINYARFTMYLDIPARNWEISFINAKYLLETDKIHFSLILYFIIKSVQKEKD